jgi:hypothetical protein
LQEFFYVFLKKCSQTQMDEKNPAAHLARFAKRKDLHFGYKKLLTDDIERIQTQEIVSKSEEGEADHLCSHLNHGNN